MSQNCKICKSKFKDTVTCDKCNSNYHPSCAELKTNIVRGVGCTKCSGPELSTGHSSPLLQNDKFDQLFVDIRALSVQMTQGFESINTQLSNLCSDVNELGSRVIANEKMITTNISHVSTLTSRIQALENKPIPDTPFEYLFNEI